MAAALERLAHTGSYQFAHRALMLRARKAHHFCTLVNTTTSHSTSHLTRAGGYLHAGESPVSMVFKNGKSNAASLRDAQHWPLPFRAISSHMRRANLSIHRALAFRRRYLSILLHAAAQFSLEAWQVQCPGGVAGKRFRATEPMLRVRL